MNLKGTYIHWKNEEKVDNKFIKNFYTSDNLRSTVSKLKLSKREFVTLLKGFTSKELKLFVDGNNHHQLMANTPEDLHVLMDKFANVTGFKGARFIEIL